jgi:PAS domain S-box-containing protein
MDMPPVQARIDDDLTAPSPGGASAEIRGQPSDDMFRRLVESVHDYAIFLLSPQGHIVSWNAGAERIKGYAASEIIGRHFSTFYTPEALAARWPEEELRRAQQFGCFEDEGWRVRKDGTRFWANVVITALFDAEGGLAGFSKITRDLTERRRHEQALKESEETLRLLVEGVKDHAIFLLDPDGRVQSWNAGAERLHGYVAEEVLGRSADIFCTEEDIAAGKPQTELAIARHAGASADTGWRVRRDGARFWADVTLTALRQRDGTLRGFAHITRDLSERRRVQELETEGRRINEFIAMLAHELRNPLAPIGNAVGILEKVGHTPELQWVTRLINRQVVHMSRLVDDLLDVSRITSGKIQLRQERLDLCAVVAAAVESMRALVTGYGHELHMNLPDEPIPVTGDPTRITQVVVNLLTNAAKYTPRGGRVEVRVEQRGAYAYLHVVDNGIGMSKPLIESAFDLFVQGERGIGREEGGLGIGLTLVKRIALLHGGNVTATSAGLGQGSAFTVSFPLGQRGAQAHEREAPASEAGGGRRVLVVDDNEDAAASLAALLRMSGYQVFMAPNGREALRQASAHPPDVILLDIGLPDLDGCEVARRLRLTPGLEGTRLVAMTGYAQEEHRRATHEAGFNAHLVKPVDPDELVRVIQAAG